MTRSRSKLLAQAAAQGLSDDELDVLADELELDRDAGQSESDEEDSSDSDTNLNATPSRDLPNTPKKPLTPPKSSKPTGVKRKRVKSAKMVQDDTREYQQSRSLIQCYTRQFSTTRVHQSHHIPSVHHQRVRSQEKG
jgi:hypothetical protein